MIKSKEELREKRAKLERKKEMIENILNGGKLLIMICFLVCSIFIGNKYDLLDELPEQYTIPEGAISGGEYIEDGRLYERYQEGNKFYVLDKQNGAKIRK